MLWPVAGSWGCTQTGDGPEGKLMGSQVPSTRNFETGSILRSSSKTTNILSASWRPAKVNPAVVMTHLMMWRMLPAMPASRALSAMSSRPSWAKVQACLHWTLDPSLGKSKVLFNMTLAEECTMCAKLSPPGLDLRTMKELVEANLNTVQLPGTSPTDNTNTTELVGALKEITEEKCTDWTEEWPCRDVQW